MLQDDVSSTVSTLLDDSQSDTPSGFASRFKGRNKKLSKPKLKFKCSNFLKVIVYFFKGMSTKIGL